MANRSIDITGKRYGRLTVIKEVEPNKYARRYLCKCDCGNEKIVYMQSLRNGNTKSCGCLQKQKVSESNFIDLTGKQFGKLTVIEKSNKKGKSRKIIWRCICDCGNEDVYVQSDKLLSGESKSCGCLRKEAGKFVQEYNNKYLKKDDIFVPLLNSKLRVDNTSGIKGVSVVKRKNAIKYQARIGLKNKSIHLGTFDTLEEAIKARKDAEEKYFKPYLE